MLDRCHEIHKLAARRIGEPISAGGIESELRPAPQVNVLVIGELLRFSYWADTVRATRVERLYTTHERPMSARRSFLVMEQSCGESEAQWQRS